MKQEEIKDWLIVAKTAVGKGDFDRFFEALPHLGKDCTSLILDAIKVAKQQKNLRVVDQFAQWKPTHFPANFRQMIFSDLVGTLVELNALEKAISLVVLYDDDALEIGARWATLGYKLLHPLNYQSLKSIYPYICLGQKTEWAQQRIATDCFQSLRVRKQLRDWLFWLKAYARLQKNEHTVLEQHLSQMADEILAVHSIQVRCEQLKEAPSGEIKDRLMIKLFERAAWSNQAGLLKHLIEILPTHLQWLNTLQQPFTRVEQFSVLNQLERRYRDFFLEKQFQAYLQAMESADEKSQVTAIPMIAQALPGYEWQVVNWGYHWLIKQNQQASAFAWLPLLTHPGARRRLISQLVSRSLTEAEYKDLLPYCVEVEYLTPDPDNQHLLKNIPAPLVAAEAKQRHEKIMGEAKALGADKSNVLKDSADYPALFSCFQQLIRCGLYESAAQLCRKITAADYRDAWVNDLLAAMLHHLSDQSALIDWDLANQIARLFHQTADAQRMLTFLATFAKTYPAKEYRAAFPALIALNHLNTQPYLGFIETCTREILDSKAETSGALFLIEQQLFSLAKTISSPHVLIQMAHRAAHDLINAADDKALIVLIDDLQKRAIEYIEDYFLDGLLKNHRLAVAVYVPLSTTGQEKIERYLTAATPSVVLVEALKSVSNADLQRRWLECLFAHSLAAALTTRISDAWITLARAIPHPALRQEYLVQLTVAAIIQGQRSQADKAVADLPSEIRGVWQAIVKLVKEGKPRELLDLLLQQRIYAVSLFEWALDQQGEQPVKIKALKAQTEQYYGSYVDSRTGEDKKADKTESTAQSSSEKNDGATCHYLMFIHAFQQWQRHQRAQKNYPVLMEACRRYFFNAEQPVTPRFDRLRYLEEVAFELIGVRHYQYIPEITGVLIAANSASVTPWLEQLLVKLLQQTELTCIESIKPQLPKSYVDYWRIKIAEYYFQRGKFEPGCRELEAVAAENKNWGNYHTAAINAVKKMIDQQQEKQAKALCERLLPDARPNAYIPLIEYFTKKGYLGLAREYLPKIVTFTIEQAQLRKKIQQTYQHKHLKPLIGPERTGYLIRSFEKMSQFMSLVKQSGREKEANHLKNELIVECRSQLDKAFLECCRQQDEAGESGRKGRIPSRYFPVVPELKGQTLDAQLRYYFKSLSLPNFPEAHPELYAYLLRIQPLQNPAYQWLSDLYALANQQKHSHDLPLTPKIAGRAIDMVEYLPQLLDGLCELLLKIADPHLSEAELAELRFSHYFTIHTGAEEGNEEEQEDDEKKSVPPGNTLNISSSSSSGSTVSVSRGAKPSFSDSRFFSASGGELKVMVSPPIRLPAQFSSSLTSPPPGTQRRSTLPRLSQTGDTSLLMTTSTSSQRKSRETRRSATSSTSGQVWKPRSPTGS